MLRLLFGHPYNPLSGAGDNVVILLEDGRMRERALVPHHGGLLRDDGQRCLVSVLVIP